MLNNIPSEMTERDQWVTFDVVEGKKLPFVAGNCKSASSTDPSTWRTFQEALEDVTTGKRQHIGYVFSSDDPYFFLDLDDPTDADQQKVLARLDTYAQTSVSGNGIHVIGRGRFEGSGKHPTTPKAGLFQASRLCLMTGAIYDNRSTINTVDNQDLQSIHSWLSSSKEYPATALEEVPSNITDEQVFIQGCKRFHTFEALTEGVFTGNHSDSDHALISMLCDLTPSNEQVRNLFSRTGMWTPEREAKKKDLTRYVDYTISQIRSKQFALQKRFSNISLDFEEPEPAQVFGLRNKIDAMPEGLLKRLSDWGHRRSEYPLQESALCAAFTLLSTVVGRNYQTYTRSGLNLWMILLAGTGTGKNDFQNIIGATVKKVSDANKFGSNFTKLFSGELASGQAVEDVMATRNRCMCYFPEFDDIYQNLTSANAAPHFRSLKKAILNAYMQSGRDGYLSRRLKARQKNDEAPDETPILSPLVILAGECTPEAFYKKLSLQDASSGFLQRFSIMEAQKESASNRPSPDAGMEMPEDLIEELLELFVHCDQLEASGEFITVKPSPEAFEMLQTYRHGKKDASLMTGMDEVTKQFYTRAGLKVIRFASVIAISADWRNPVILPHHVEYAIALVDEMDDGVLDKFKGGEMGTGQNKQEAEIMKVFNEFAMMSTAKRKKAGMSDEIAENKKIMPHLFLKKRVVMSPSFVEARESVSAFERCLKHMEDSGQIAKVPEELYDVKSWCLV